MDHIVPMDMNGTVSYKLAQSRFVRRNCIMWYILGPVLLFGVVAAYDCDWWEHAVIYRIYTRSFKDSDGDGIGDLNGIASKLEYLKNLDVDAAWLTPIFRSPLKDYGYDVSDYYTVHGDFGTMEDFEALLAKAKALDIKIILELVPNHSSDTCDWFLRSASKEEYYNHWYVWAKGHKDASGKNQPPNNWLSVHGGSAWSYEPKRDEFYLHQFSKHQPDLNFRNPVVVEEFKNILKFWLEKGVSGFSMSSVNYLLETDKDLFAGQYPNEPPTGTPGVGPSDYNYLDHIHTKDQNEVYDLITQYRKVFEHLSLRNNVTRILLTEAKTGIKNTVRYYDEDNTKRAHVPVNYGFIEEIDKDLDARTIKFVIDRFITYKPLKKHPNWMLGDHDTSRVANRFGTGLIDAFNMLVLLLPGIAITYMGEEIGMNDGAISWVNTVDPLACNTDDPIRFVNVSRDPYRTPFQWDTIKNAGFSANDSTWLPVNKDFMQINVASELAVRSHILVYKTLIKLRKRHAFSCGHYDSLAFNSDVFAFKRWHGDDSYVVLINFGTASHRINLTAFDLIFGQLEVETSSVLSERTYGDTVTANSIEMAGEEALVLRMQV